MRAHGVLALRALVDAHFSERNMRAAAAFITRGATMTGETHMVEILNYKF